jgi:F-type H+-transporting ATPase subunit b
VVTTPAAPVSEAATPHVDPAHPADSHAADTHEGTEAAHGANEPFPPFDATYFPSTLLWLAITFIGLYWVIWKLAIPRIAGIIERRRAHIEGDVAAAEKMKSDAEAAAARYEKSLAEARAGGAKIAEAARQKARSAADAKRAEIESSLNAKLAAAEGEIGGIKTRALGEVGNVARDAAAEIVRTLTGVDVSQRDVADAVDKSMAR